MLESYGTSSFHSFRELLSSTGRASGVPVLACVFGVPLWPSPCGGGHALCPDLPILTATKTWPGHILLSLFTQLSNPENALRCEKEWLTVVSGLDLLLLYSRLPLSAQFPETLDSSSVKWRLIIGLTLYEK